MTFSAIILDMDGVFIDSEPLVFDIFRSVFSPLGITLSNEYQYRFVGKPFRANLQDIHRDFGIEFDDGEVRRLFDSAYETVLSSRPLPLQRGILPIIDKARELVLKLALCTTTSRHQVDVVFEQIRKSGAIDPRKLFDTVITGNDVTHKKPHPEPYLNAAQALNVPPHRCLAIEDTITGIASAQAAGCRTAALRQPYNLEMDFPAADWIVDDLHEIIGLLEGA
jgi:beta-phosphoglucomutase